MDRVRKQLWLPDNLPFDGRGIRIGVIDSGVDTSHPDLRDAIDWDRSENYAWNSTSLEDRCYHGTHIAGIIAGRGTASGGRYRGVAPAATLIVYKVCEGPSGMDMDVAGAISDAIDDKVDIINYSAGFAPDVGPPPWVWPPAMSIIEKAFAEAAAAGILCVVAAGNSGPKEGSVNRPGGHTDVLTVGALDEEGNVDDISARGPYRVLASLNAGGERRYDPLFDVQNVEHRRKPDLVAPGMGVVSTRAKHGVYVRAISLTDPADPDCPYMMDGATSQATAVTTGFAALLLDAARRSSIDLGPNVGQSLKRLMMHQLPQPKGQPPEAYGAGSLKWPSVYEVLVDMKNDEHLRRIIANGDQLPLLN